MFSKPTAGLVLALSLAPLVTSCVAGSKNAVNVLGAYRATSGDFTGASGAPALGIEGLLGLTNDGIGLEGGYLYSKSTSTDADIESELKSSELFAGARMTWNTDGQAQPYFAAGVNWIHGDLTDSLSPELAGDGPGVYLRTGVGIQLGLFQLGFDLRGSLSNATVEDENLSYVQTGIFLGASF